MQAPELANSKIIIRDSGKAGPTIAILVGIHGNEKCGINAINTLLPQLTIAQGKVLFVTCNLRALQENKRCIEVNLNRCFRKDSPHKHTLEGQTAQQLMQVLDTVDILLDIHASNSTHSPPFAIAEQHTWHIAQHLPCAIISSGWDQFEPGATDDYMNSPGKIGIGIECGYTNDPNSTIVAQHAILNFLKATRVIAGTPEKTSTKKYYSIKELYKNTHGAFKKSREFADFEHLQEKTLVGRDGKQPLYREKGDVILFVRDRDELGEECFIVMKEEHKTV